MAGRRRLAGGRREQHAGMAAPQPGSIPPTGEQHEIRYGDQRATVVEVGGGLREYVVGDTPALDGYSADDFVVGAHGQTLVPWPNRLADGTYDWAGDTYQLPLSEPSKRNAIHGLARFVPWSLEDRSDRHLTMHTRLYPQPGWPFWLDLHLTYRLDDRGLSVRTTARNVGGSPCPYGSGAHPYLTAGTRTVDSCRLQLPAERYIETDRRSLPKKTRRVRGSKLDFRTARKIGGTTIDHAFTDLRRDPDGRFRTRLIGPKGRVVALWQDEAYPYVEIFTGDALPKRKRRTGLGVEPMTMPPNGLHDGVDVVTLEPGQIHSAEWGIEPFGHV